MTIPNCSLSGWPPYAVGPMPSRIRQKVSMRLSPVNTRRRNPGFTSRKLASSNGQTYRSFVMPTPFLGNELDHFLHHEVLYLIQMIFDCGHGCVEISPHHGIRDLPVHIPAITDDLPHGSDICLIPQ